MGVAVLMGLVGKGSREAGRQGQGWKGKQGREARAVPCRPLAAS